MDEKELFHLDGGVGDILSVYNDYVVIQHKGVLNFLAMGIKGDKTIYYTDITSVQFKKPGFTTGYIQFSLSGGRENADGVMGAMQDENSIAIKSKAVVEAERIVEFINQKLHTLKSGRNMNGVISAADEIKKYKELFDLGIISQEEFEIKRKQLLGL